MAAAADRAGAVPEQRQQVRDAANLYLCESDERRSLEQERFLRKNFNALLRPTGERTRTELAAQTRPNGTTCRAIRATLTDTECRPLLCDDHTVRQDTARRSCHLLSVRGRASRRPAAALNCCPRRVPAVAEFRLPPNEPNLKTDLSDRPNDRPADRKRKRGPHQFSAHCVERNKTEQENGTTRSEPSTERSSSGAQAHRLLDWASAPPNQSRRRSQ